MKVDQTRQRDGTILRRRKCPDKHATTFTVEAVEPCAA